LARFSHQGFFAERGLVAYPQKKKRREGRGKEKRRLLSFCTRVFLFVNYVRSQTGEHPEEDLVKFGYKLNVKVFLKIKNRFFFKTFWLFSGKLL
jgi:hypothetical protein